MALSKICQGAVWTVSIGFPNSPCIPTWSPFFPKLLSSHTTVTRHLLNATHHTRCWGFQVSKIERVLTFKLVKPQDFPSMSVTMANLNTARGSARYSSHILTGTDTLNPHNWSLGEGLLQLSFYILCIYRLRPREVDSSTESTQK